MLPTLLLNATNHVALRGPVTEESVSRAVHAALALPAPPGVLLLDTPGGSVFAGQRMIDLVVQLGLACLAVRAHSMGFAILQHCAERWVTAGATLMQHGVSVRRVDGDVRRVAAYLRMVEAAQAELDAAQAARLGVGAAWFRNRTRDEWWLTARAAVAARAADGVVHARCAPPLARANVTDEDGTVWSACPLVASPLARTPAAAQAARVHVHVHLPP